MKAKKTPSGNYRVQLVDGYDLNGKRIVKSFTAKTEFKSLHLRFIISSPLTAYMCEITVVKGFFHSCLMK